MNQNNAKVKRRGVREILLQGVFCRILFIEAVLLVFSLGYKWLTEDATALDLLWYGIRITILVAIIIAFMMLTLKTFLSRKIISPLEAIASSNKNIQENFTETELVDIGEKPPHEIETLVTSRTEMLNTIFRISEERLKYSRALNDELERGKKVQNDFLPRSIPETRHFDISSYFHSALQLSGDFYDVFELPHRHIGFVVGDVSDKGVGSALFMALARSLLRIFSGSFSTDDMKTHYQSNNGGFSPKDVLQAVYLTNEYLSKEHGEEGMFVTLFFAVLDPGTGEVSYINGGHEPVLVVGKNGIKQSLSTTGPALGPIPGATYRIETIKLDAGDTLFGYTDGVTEACSEGEALYTRTRLKKALQKGFNGSAAAFLDTVKKDLFAFTKNAPQSDDITMLAAKWRP